MGVDIYGLSPKLTKPKPEIPDDYQDLDSDDQKAFWDIIEEWEQENPGYYFRNNWWHWRPIQMLISVFNESYNLNIPADEIKSLGGNDGNGVKDKGQCEQLASCFKQFVEMMKKENQKVVYLNTGWWHFADKQLNGGKSIDDQELIDKLNEKYPGLFFEAPTLNGVDYEASHGTNVDNLEEFALFLENCNGFEIH